MIVIIGTEEMTLELLSPMVTAHPEFGTRLNGLGRLEWECILAMVARELLYTMGGHGIIASRPALQALAGFFRDYGGIEPGEAAKDLARDFDSEILDRYRLEIQSLLRPHVVAGSLWEVKVHQGCLRISYVGDGLILKDALTAAGQDYRSLVDELYKID